MKRIKTFIEILFFSDAWELETGHKVRLSMKQAWWLSSICQ